MDAVQKFQLGSLRCHIEANPPRYGRLLAEAYGIDMSTELGHDFSPDLMIHFSERPEPPASL